MTGVFEQRLSGGRPAKTLLRGRETGGVPEDPDRIVGASEPHSAHTLRGGRWPHLDSAPREPKKIFPISHLKNRLYSDGE